MLFITDFSANWKALDALESFHEPDLNEAGSILAENRSVSWIQI
jgi:hypothetical protein